MDITYWRKERKFKRFCFKLPKGIKKVIRPKNQRLNIKSIIEEEIVSSLREKKESLLKKISAKLISEEKVSEELAINSAKEGFDEVERLLANHSEAV